MREIWQSTVEVWSWLMQHLWFINVLLSIAVSYTHLTLPTILRV